MEMMESYEEPHIGPSHADQCDLHDVKIHETCLSANCTTLMATKQNFDFGAEIVGTQAIEPERESDIKTNGESIATTATVATVAVAASSTSPNVNQSSNIETPLNVAELPIKGTLANDHGSQIDEDEVDNDGGESYQSDDDDMDEDGNEDYQQECRGNMHNDASLDSDESTSDSDFSDLSGLSDMSGREWKPISARPINWVQKQIHAGANPRDLLSQMLPSNTHPIAPGVNDMMLWRILASMLSEPPRRQKLRYINTFEDVIQLIQQSKNIIVLTGAGVSVSCGIPDFRSSDGIYCRLAKDFPNLPDPQAMFDISYFSRDPRPFFKFAREIYPGQFKPSPCHRFIKLLEEKQKLLRNYTQNIDTLEKVAGIKNVIECHGSFSTASCTKCKVKCTADAIRDDIFSQRIPVCPRCQPNVHQSVNASDAVSDADLRQLVENGIMKPDIVFFGEGLPEEFHTVMAGDKDRCDLLIVIGSSLKVRPVALIPSSIPANVPQILINREQLHHLEFDVELLGDSDVIINQLCHRLGDDWKDICYDNFILKESKELLPVEEEDTNDESEEDGQQMLDTDTQSVKSSASTDLALRSAVAYSDSGFESSTSSGMVLAKQNIAAASNEAKEAIEKIKTTILEMHQPLTKTRQGSKPGSVNYLEEPSDAVDFETRSFQPFNERVSEQYHHHTTCGANTRHPSVDSTKDSGIVADCSISAQISNNVIGILPPPITNFGDSGGTKAMNDPFTALPTCTDNKTTPAATVTRIESPPPPQMVSDTEKISTAVTIRRSAKKYRTAAERLLEGTYYAHETVSAYVFPGAQVSWSSDVEEEDEENGIIGNIYDDVDEDDIDANGGPLSPLLPPSVEAEVVSEITTTSAFAICAKRTLPASYSISGEINQAADMELQTDSNKNSSVPSNTTATTCSATETTCDRVSVTMPPSPSPSPQKRACECPPTLGGSDSNVETNDSSRSSNIGKSECHAPPLKRKRSTDDQKNLVDVFPEVCIDATQSGNINDTPLLSSGVGGADAVSPKEYATQLVQN
ncbi:PREDICTED: NAD-dependent histone deacetylase Sir2-like [Rhagoletis zephyria]|uniref:NAD-dependent histone deacetylase Sir2-like n=1 Tax=Rhagoletis zephyria TaxID=28612 RepID=UPI0008116416|nr:PREDICTED: NAD-dependent histone deacetylase Sir2-like [Rhagoletis zephyria]